MNKKIFLIILFSLSLLTVSYLLATKAFAQLTSLDLTAYPSTFSINIKPGDNTTQRFRIRNNSTNPLVLSLSLKKLSPDTQGNTTIKDFIKQDDYQNWISFDKTTLTALPQEWTDVNFTVKVPKDTAFGYYFAIYISPLPTSQKTNSPQASLTGSIAIPVLLTVDKPGATIDGKMLSFISSVYFSEYLPINFLTTFINTGNIFFRPTGSIFIKDSFGNTIDTLTINSTGGAILPGGKRTYTTSWDNSFITEEPVVKDGTTLKDSHGNPQTHMVFHFDRVLNLRIGKYTATSLTVIPTPQRDISSQSTVVFWVFPWKIVGLAVLIVILAGIGAFNTGKSIVRGVRNIIKR